MDLRHLRYFLAVAERHSFTKGAEKVGISQPSLSVQIALLEEELGTPLFDRLGRQVTLTEAGRLLHAHAERILRETELVMDSIRDLTGAEGGRLVVGALSTVNSYVVPPLVCRFKQRFPGIQLEVRAQASSLIEEELTANRIDVGICLLPVTSPRLITSRMFTETLALVAPVDAPLAGTRIRMRELANLPLVLLPTDYCLRRMIEGVCATAGVRPQVSVEMTSPEGILEAVREGLGYTILPELYVRRRVREGRLRLVHLHEPVPRHAVGIAYHASRHMGKAAQEFVRLCRLTIQALRIEREASTLKDSGTAARRVAIS